MFFDEKLQQDVTEPEDKPCKENVPQNVGQLSTEEEEAEIEGEQIEEGEWDKEEEKEECDADIVPFITQIENLQRQSRQSQYFQSGTMQQSFYMQKALKPKFY